jgi:hypothetical protein
MNKFNWSQTPKEETGREEYLRKEVYGDDPVKAYRSSRDGQILFKDEYFDDTPAPREPIRETSELFKQVIADTISDLKRIGEIK